MSTTPVSHKFLRNAEKFLLGTVEPSEAARLRDVLEENGWQVTTAAGDALEGFQAIWVGPPDLDDLLQKHGFHLHPAL